MEAEHTEWLIPCNLDHYDLTNALIKLKKIDWRQTKTIKNAQVGDIVYIYCSSKKTTGTIAFKGAVLDVNKSRVTNDDTDFGGSLDLAPCFEIAVFREYDFNKELTFNELKKHGLKGSIMGPRKVKGELASYLHKCDKLQIASDRVKGTIPPACLIDFPIKIKEDLSVIEAVDEQGLDPSYSEEEIIKHADSLDMDVLKKIAKKQSNKKPKKVKASVEQIQRNIYIAEYAKRKAKGTCQLCGNPAPFNRADGEPYLESHHIVWLSKGGEDSIENTVALCPNCHRKMHVLNDSKDIEYLMQVSGKDAD